MRLLRVPSFLPDALRTAKPQGFRAFIAPEGLVRPVKSIAFRSIRAILEVVGLYHTEINKGFAGTYLDPYT